MSEHGYYGQMSTSTDIIEQPPGRLLRNWSAAYSTSGLYRQENGDLQIWHRFGTVGWLHIGNARKSGDEVTVEPVESWQNHPWPYDITIAKVEVQYALTGPR